MIFDDNDNDEKRILAYQALINSGDVWSLSGFEGRQAMALIKEGLCILGVNGCRDYWGNYVPSRTEVQAGTRGSVEFAQAQTSEDWVKRLLEVK